MPACQELRRREGTRCLYHPEMIVTRTYARTDERDSTTDDTLAMREEARYTATLQMSMTLLRSAQTAICGP